MIAEVIRTTKVDIVCMEETKFTYPNPQILGSIAPRKFYNFYFLNAKGASGGF